MCGIAGILGSTSTSVALADNVRRMIAALVHRGPDDAGVWTDPAATLGLGNRRLAVVDPSVAGHQPMFSPSQRYVATVNGEIYNHQALRTRLETEGFVQAWRGSSDIEVLSAAFDAWGIEATIAASVGMFAAAIWDRETRTLMLARDRLGEKPLHYGHFGGAWLFGSELKALVAHPSCNPVIDEDALAAYMALGYVPAPASIYRRIGKVRAGCIVSLRADDVRPQERVYWSAVAQARLPRHVFESDGDAIDQLEALLTTAVGQQMSADRPVGALLSGGIDSSAIVAMMRARSVSHFETFSIGFRQSAFNEAHHAADVARHFGTVHTELYVDANDVRDTIVRLPQIYDEPFADVSQVPTFLVSQLASRSVTVALTGDGGDELFGGYPRYGMGAALWRQMQRVPDGMRPLIGDLLSKTPASIDRLFAWLSPHDESSGVRGIRPAQKLNKLGRAIGSDDARDLYWRLLAPWGEPALLRRSSFASVLPPDLESIGMPTIEENFMLRDLVGYLPDDILAKVDRAAMAVSLEPRSPLLDHRIVDFALRLPSSMKFRRGVGKWLLRQVLHRYIPKKLVDRPKMGFGIPIASWLRGPLKPWAYDLVASSRDDAADLLDLDALRRLLDRHSAGTGDWHLPIWTALMVLNWSQAMKHDRLPYRDLDASTDRLAVVRQAI